MHKTNNSHIFRFWVTVAVVITSFIIWLSGLLQSPLFRPEIHREPIIAERYSKELAPDQREKKILAEAYWRRYPDIRNDPYYGKNGPMGLNGAREHFEQHGKYEGRIMAPILIPDDLAYEHQLAEAYWKRYPHVEKSAIWGRNGALGVLGPRDYYNYLGKQSGHKWGISK